MNGGEYFAGPDPDDFGPPRLPEAYFPQAIAGMIPGDIVHLKPEPEYIMASELGEVSLNVNSCFDPDEAANPDYENESYVAVMRIYKNGSEGKLIDGYIIDLSQVMPGDIFIMDEIAKDGLPDFVEQTPVLGIISYNTEDEACYVSELREETIEDALRLAEAVDIFLVEDEQGTQEKITQTNNRSTTNATKNTEPRER